MNTSAMAAQQKRVLILHRGIPPYRKAAFNGLANYYDVTVLHPGPPTLEATDNYREVIVPARAMGPFVLQTEIAATLARHRPDVVIAMLDLRWPAQLLPILARRNRDVRWIFWGPGYGRSRLANRVRDRLLRRADALLLYGSTDVDTFVRRGMPRDRVFVAPNTIHVPTHRDLSAERKSSLLFVGRLQKRKRLDLLIDAFAKVADVLPQDTTLEIVGDTPGPVSRQRGFGHFKLDLETRSNLQQKALAAGLGDRVVFHAGTENEEDLALFFARAYAYVCPEAVGLGALHSFAYGVPVITRRGQYPSHGAEIENLKSGLNSLLYDSDATLADALCAICNTPGLYARLGASAYRHYSTARTLDSMLDGFRRAIAPPPPPPPED